RSRSTPARTSRRAPGGRDRPPSRRALPQARAERPGAGRPGGTRAAGPRRAPRGRAPGLGCASVHLSSRVGSRRAWARRPRVDNPRTRNPLGVGARGPVEARRQAGPRPTTSVAACGVDAPGDGCESGANPETFPGGTTPEIWKRFQTEDFDDEVDDSDVITRHADPGGTAGRGLPGLDVPRAARDGREPGDGRA